MLGPSAKWPGPTGSFDGNPSSGTGLSGASPSGSDLIWNGTIEFSNSCLIYWYVETTNDFNQWVTGSSGRTNVTSSITKITGSADLNTIVPIDVTSAGSPITKLECGAKYNTGAGIARIVVDGVDLLDGMATIISTGYPNANTMTVDGGAWLGADGSGVAGDGRYEPSQEWSNGLSIPSGLASGSLQNQFDSDLATYANPAEATDAWTFTSPTTIILTQNIKLKPPFVESFTYTWTINSDNGVSDTITDTSFYELQGTAGLTIGPGNPLVIGSSNPDVAPKFTGMQVNNKLLVDSSIPGGGGDTAVTVGPFTAEGTFLSAVGTEVDLSASSGRWIADNKAGIDFSIAGPAVIDNPLLTADVVLESTPFSTTPADADTLKGMVWELNGVEQNAGIANPYKPTLTTGTTYTVRVKHEANGLPDSAWSTSTTFKTGATRTLQTYYVEKVDTLMARIATLEKGSTPKKKKS